MQKNHKNGTQTVCSMVHHFAQCPFTAHVTWDWKRAWKCNIHAKDSSLEKFMAVLWSCYCVLDAKNLWGWFLHREAVKVTLVANHVIMFYCWQLHWDSYLCSQENHRNGEEIQAHVDECSQAHTIFTLSHPWCPHNLNHTLPCWSPTEGTNGYCHSAWEFYSIIVVYTDYTEHIDDVSVQTTHFQVSIGTCKFFYFILHFLV